MTLKTRVQIPLFARIYVQMKKKQNITIPPSCITHIKKNRYVFSGSLGKTILHMSQCDSFGTRFRTPFKNQKYLETAFVESYESLYTPFVSETHRPRKIRFHKKKDGESFAFSMKHKDWCGEKTPFQNGMSTEKKQIVERHGSLRPLEAKMYGAAYGYVLFLKLIGLGYKFSLYPSQKKQDSILLSIKAGHSHKVKFFIPKSVGIFLFPRNTLAIFSSEQEIIANLAYQIREVRPPTRYKGKGIRFLNEIVLLKEGKKTK